MMRFLLPRRLEDERLARRVARGDAEAFAVLYERYHRPLLRYCLATLRHPEDADDALQAAMLKAYRSLARGMRDAPLRPWLYRIARNEALSILRRRSKDLRASTDSAATASAFEEALGRERLAALVVEIASLPERQRSALLMREVQGLAYDEIAQALDTTRQAARQAVFEARAALRGRRRFAFLPAPLAETAAAGAVAASIVLGVNGSTVPSVPAPARPPGLGVAAEAIRHTPARSHVPAWLFAGAALPGSADAGGGPASFK
jgi:RNA polymerase sigma factor (sigma-70 family)